MEANRLAELGRWKAYLGVEDFNVKPKHFPVRPDQAAHMAIAAREQIATAYRELKSYEIVVERKREHAKLKENRRQQSILDEIGQVVHRTRAARTFA